MNVRGVAGQEHPPHAILPDHATVQAKRDHPRGVVDDGARRTDLCEHLLEVRKRRLGLVAGPARLYRRNLGHSRRLNARGLTAGLTYMMADSNPQGVVAVLDLATDVQLFHGEISQPIISRAWGSLVADAAFDTA